MEFVQFLGADNVARFFLLFTRLSGMFAFTPIFSHMGIPITIKTAMALFFTIFLFPYTQTLSFEQSITTLSFAFLSELMIGFISGLMLFLVFAMLQLAGEQISFVMGFTMASVLDPQSGSNMPLIGQLFTLLATVVFLIFDGHHMLILFYHQSLEFLPLGTFHPDANIWKYLSTGVTNLFVFGFILSFPIKALSLLADLVFGMLMKTMPQFNLLTVGTPMKTAVSLFVLIATLGAIMSVFKKEVIEVINALPFLFF